MPAPRLLPSLSATLEERSDDELMTLVQTGSRAAFEVLIDRYAKRLVGACARFVDDHHLGADLAQETWVAVWTHRSQYKAEGRFVVWLLTLGRNRCRNHVRHRSVATAHARREATQAALAPSPNQIDELLLAEKQRRVRGAVGRLPRRMQEALLLRYAEDLPYDQMAEILSVGESTLRSRVHHGLRLLKKFLEDRS